MEDEEAAAAAMRASKRRRSVQADDQQVQPGSSSQQEEQQSDLVDLIGRRLDDLISRRLICLHEDAVGAILSLFPTKDGARRDYLISRLPDDVLGAIVSLVPAKDGARTQLLSRRWSPLWRSSMAPLDLVADWNLVNGDIHKRIAVISKILSDHPGPTRCFSLHDILVPESLGEIDGWFRSPSLNNLQELEVTYHGTTLYPLPPSVLRFAPTLRVAEFGSCQFPDLIARPSLNFPHLKQLALCCVTISDESIHILLSGCAALESLSLHDIDFGCLRINSSTLKSISFYIPFTPWNQESQELVIEDTPCLERLVPLDPDCGRVTIQVIRAPKLEILGLLSEGISTLHIGTTIFQKMIAVNLTTQMDTVKILVLNSVGPNLSSVVSFLKCFPCLEKLYVSISHPQKDMNNVRKYDKLDPTECLELHLKKVVLKDYDGNKRPTIEFAKFFILNAKVLEEMEIGVLNRRNDKWMRYQSRQLQVENRASRDAKIELKRDAERKFKHHRHTHDFSMDDPFDRPY